MIILDGKKIALARQEKLTKQIKGFLVNNQRAPQLIVLMVGDDEASQVYVAHKIKLATKVGINSKLICFDKNVAHEVLYSKINQLNNDPLVDGILLQLPLPSTYFEEEYLQAIAPEKDVDGFHYSNQGKMLQGYDSTFPCTPLGILNLLKEYQIDVKHQNVTVIGTSNIVGKPLAMMLVNEQATVTMCNKFTKDISQHTKNADIVISATGQKFIITADMVKQGVIIVDVGIIRDSITNKLVGDVDFEQVKQKAKYITPVPGGVGPMTVITLMENTFKLYKAHLIINK